MDDPFTAHLLSLPAQEFRLEAIRRIYHARTARGKRRAEHLRREDICARVAARRPDGPLEWQRALRTVSEALMVPVAR